MQALTGKSDQTIWPAGGEPASRQPRERTAAASTLIRASHSVPTLGQPPSPAALSPSSGAAGNRSLGANAAATAGGSMALQRSSASAVVLPKFQYHRSEKMERTQDFMWRQSAALLEQLPFLEPPTAICRSYILPDEQQAERAKQLHEKMKKAGMLAKPPTPRAKAARAEPERSGTRDVVAGRAQRMQAALERDRKYVAEQLAGIAEPTASKEAREQEEQEQVWTSAFAPMPSPRKFLPAAFRGEFPLLPDSAVACSALKHSGQHKKVSSVVQVPSLEGVEVQRLAQLCLLFEAVVPQSKPLEQLLDERVIIKRPTFCHLVCALGGLAVKQGGRCRLLRAAGVFDGLTQRLPLPGRSPEVGILVSDIPDTPFSKLFGQLLQQMAGDLSSEGDTKSLSYKERLRLARTRFFDDLLPEAERYAQERGDRVLRQIEENRAPAPEASESTTVEDSPAASPARSPSKKRPMRPIKAGPLTKEGSPSPKAEKQPAVKSQEQAGGSSGSTAMPAQDPGRPSDQAAAMFARANILKGERLSSQLVEPEVLHFVAEFSGLFAQLFEAYRDVPLTCGAKPVGRHSSGHMSLGAFLRFCGDLGIFPSKVDFQTAQWLYNTASGCDEVRGATPPPPLDDGSLNGGRRKLFGGLGGKHKKAGGSGMGASSRLYQSARTRRLSGVGADYGSMGEDGSGGDSPHVPVNVETYTPSRGIAAPPPPLPSRTLSIKMFQSAIKGPTASERSGDGLSPKDQQGETGDSGGENHTHRAGGNSPLRSPLRLQHLQQHQQQLDGPAGTTSTPQQRQSQQQQQRLQRSGLVKSGSLGHHSSESESSRHGALMASDTDSEQESFAHLRRGSDTPSSMSSTSTFTATPSRHGKMAGKKRKKKVLETHPEEDDTFHWHGRKLKEHLRWMTKELAEMTSAEHRSIVLLWAVDAWLVDRALELHDAFAFFQRKRKSYVSAEDFRVVVDFMQLENPPTVSDIAELARLVSVGTTSFDSYSSARGLAPDLNFASLGMALSAAREHRNRVGGCRNANNFLQDDHKLTRAEQKAYTFCRGVLEYIRHKSITPEDLVAEVECSTPGLLKPEELASQLRYLLRFLPMRTDALSVESPFELLRLDHEKRVSVKEFLEILEHVREASVIRAVSGWQHRVYASTRAEQSLDKRRSLFGLQSFMECLVKVALLHLGLHGSAVQAEQSSFAKCIWLLLFLHWQFVQAVQTPEAKIAEAAEVDFVEKVTSQRLSATGPVLKTRYIAPRRRLVMKSPEIFDHAPHQRPPAVSTLVAMTGGSPADQAAAATAVLPVVKQRGCACEHCGTSDRNGWGNASCEGCSFADSLLQACFVAGGVCTPEDAASRPRPAAAQGALCRRLLYLGTAAGY
eukprot:TRINITY_DN8195_c1_g1_i1.p1 TRINITY_DN8195_c1_g1~~TRINITY_DN8195_c1_g1_i1.p1  ORF type:complete len:1369 (-),score=320.86 TRINITY_DN8195_c1_g1_i1:139-4245(-)